jgi:ankyrin repeat protein
MMLSNKTVNINKTDKYGINAFWIAAFYGNIEVMKSLVDRGADIFARNHNGSNALHIAVKKNNFSIVQALVNIKYPLN